VSSSKSDSGRRSPDDRLANVETDILYDTGAVINALPFAAGAHKEQTGFMHQLRRDGLDL
jgi:uncharacterized protein